MFELNQVHVYFNRVSSVKCVKIFMLCVLCIHVTSVLAYRGKLIHNGLVSCFPVLPWQAQEGYPYVPCTNMFLFDLELIHKL
jgi:hypothetical protein